MYYKMLLTNDPDMPTDSYVIFATILNSEYGGRMIYKRNINKILIKYSFTYEIQSNNTINKFLLYNSNYVTKLTLTLLRLKQRTMFPLSLFYTFQLIFGC